MADAVSLAQLGIGQFNEQKPLSLSTLGNAPPRVLPSDYNTKLNQLDELSFLSWVKNNNVPFNPRASTSDYDMRGFWQGLQQGDPRATGRTSINANDGMLHYPDDWKTPAHRSFSSGSQWAGPAAPAWNERDQLVSPGGRVVFDERAR